MTFSNVSFGDVTDNFDKKRIPLSAAQREKRQGKYRYYGAQGVIDWVDDYIFDGTYLLIAEDGENLKSKKSNIAQLASGKFWVNNHAHVIQCKKGYDIISVLFDKFDRFIWLYNRISTTEAKSI